MALPHQLVEAPFVHGDRIWQFALQGSQELSREGDGGLFNFRIGAAQVK